MSNTMTPAQQLHLEKILDYLTLRTAAKYEAGAKEHGGTLTDMSESDLLDNAIEEAIDQCVYLITLRQKFNKKA